MKNEISTKNIIKLTWPAILSQATIILVGIIDMIFIGQVGTVALAAVAMASIVSTTIYNFLDGLKYGTTVMTARFLGAGEKNNISRILLLSLVTAIVVGVFIMLIAYPLSVGTFNLVSDQSIRFDGIDYLYILTLATPFVMIFFAFTGFFRGLGDTLTPLWVTLIIGVVDAVMDYILIYGKLGFPVMGVKGAAVASFIAYVAGAIASLIVIFRSKLSKPYIKLRISVKKIAKEYFTISAEIGAFSGFYYLSLCIFALIFGKLGAMALAVYQITNQVFLILYLPPKGFAISSSIIVGKLFGAERQDLVYPGIKKIFKLAAITYTAISIIVFIFAPLIAGLFSPNDLEVARIVVTTIRIVCIEQFIAIGYFIPMGALTGAEDTRFLMWEDIIVEYLILLPLAYFLVLKMGYGILGGYAAFFVRTIINSSILLIRLYWTTGWLKKKVS